MLESARSWLDFLSTSEGTCSTSWQPLVDSLSLPAGAVLSAIALWVASRARSTSKDALLTSEAVKTLSLLASPSSLAMGEPVRRGAHEKLSSTTQDPAGTSTSLGEDQAL